MIRAIASFLLLTAGAVGSADARRHPPSSARRAPVASRASGARGDSRVVRGPVCSSDGVSCASIEHGVDGSLRLVVVPDVADPAEPLVWTLPGVTSSEVLRLFWISATRVQVGDDLMHPRFIASWEVL